MDCLMHATLPLLVNTDFPALRRSRPADTLQVNLGYTCNQSCLHCHVNAGPTRTEQMDLDTVNTVLDVLRAGGIGTLDLTGGAPELNPHFRYLVDQARQLGVKVIDRCNLTILDEPGQETLADFLSQQGVEIVASLPCYLEDNVDRQRGKGVFDTSMRMLQKLNALGYGDPDGRLALNLVYNPQGPSLPPSQAALKADYDRILGERFGIRFNQLFTITNMPIQRFGSTLISTGKFNSYMTLLRSAHQDANLPGVMCRSLVSVDWKGYLYDCDFNQMLGLPLKIGGAGQRPRPHLRDLLDQSLEGNPIAVADHCWGCTAGAGSSCGGALA
ncbi:MAG: radical SAM/Cys-rich domain family protein [Herminiimonas sp.]|nr:radical SAM/Cys-rich domain family protein [Herminiimonas sp.]